VFSLAEYNDELVAGGSFTMAGGQPVSNIARWNGSAWRSLGSGVGPMAFGSVYAMTTYNNELCVGGYLSTAGGTPANRIARWDGSDWRALGSGLSGTSNVFALGVFRAELIVGGVFSIAGGTPANSIAAWDGAAWHAIGSGIMPGGYPHAVHALAVLGDRLFVGGNFASAGGLSSPEVAVLAFCAADFDCDDLVTSQDFFQFVDLFFAGAPGADFNHDGVVNAQDFFDFLAAFFVGCA
jgi:hypothetical protein